jgi:hypothetical protein
MSNADMPAGHPIALTISHAHNRNSMRFEISDYDRMRLPFPLPAKASFNADGGIDLDYGGAWAEGETIDLPIESLAVSLLRLAFMVAYIENTNE